MKVSISKKSTTYSKHSTKSQQLSIKRGLHTILKTQVMKKSFALTDK